MLQVINHVGLQTTLAMTKIIYHNSTINLHVRSGITIKTLSKKLEGTILQVTCLNKYIHCSGGSRLLKGRFHLKHLIHGSMHADTDLASWNATDHP